MVIRVIMLTVPFVIFSIQSCTIKDNKMEKVFSEVLAGEILDYISSTEGWNSNYIYYIWGDSIDENKYIFLGHGLCYEKGEISSYTFLNDKLIIFNEFHEKFPFEGWIDSANLVKFKDSIPNSNYKECSSIENFPDFDPKIRQLQIIFQDSLRVVGTSMGQYQFFLKEKIRYLQETGKEKELEELYDKMSLHTIPAVQPAKFIPPELK